MPRSLRYRVEIRPLLVATIQRLPQRTIESIFPTPGRPYQQRISNVPRGEVWRVTNNRPLFGTFANQKTAHNDCARRNANANL